MVLWLSWQQFGFLYARYRSKYYWWELTVTARKLMVATIVAFAAGSTGQNWIFQGWAGFLGLFGFLIATMVCTPFVDRRLTRLEELSLFVNSSTIGLGIVYSVSPDDPLITTAIIALIALHILVLVVALFVEAGQRFTQHKAAQASYDKDFEMSEIMSGMSFTREYDDDLDLAVGDAGMSSVSPIE